MNEIESAQFLEQHPHLRLSDQFIQDFERDVDDDRSPAYGNRDNRLALAREKQRELRESGQLKKPVFNPAARFAEKPTLRRAVGAKCYECVGSGYDSTWRNDIRHCQIDSCPLWQYRPYQSKD